MTPERRKVASVGCLEYQGSDGSFNPQGAKVFLNERVLLTLSAFVYPHPVLFFPSTMARALMGVGHPLGH